MRVAIIAVAVIPLLEQSSAFSLTSLSSSRVESTRTSINSSEDPTTLESSETSQEGGEVTKKPLSPAEILANAKAKAGIDDDDEAPRLFAESLYDDMKQALVTLDKRAKQGPGSIGMLEAEDFNGMMQRVLVDMKQKENDRLNGVPDAAATAPPQQQQQQALNQAATIAQQQPAPSTSQPQPQQQGESKIIDTSNDEGPAYDGTGGLGLAKGTANTYVIPGMDAMSPEEYQKSLQQSIIDRQTRRKQNGTYGNRNSGDYLNSLSGGSSFYK